MHTAAGITGNASCRRTWEPSSTVSTIDPTSNYNYIYNYTSEDIITDARYAKAVRDGFASFFFHPFGSTPRSASLASRTSRT